MAHHDGGTGAVRETDANERGSAGGTVPGSIGRAVPGEAEGAKSVSGGAQQNHRPI